MRGLVMLLCCWIGTAPAAVFRWVDGSGAVHYADRPPTPDARPAALPPLQIYRDDARPSLPPERPRAAPPTTTAIRISAPAAEETIRDPQAGFTVEVAAAPAPGEGLVFYLDGVAQNTAPTPSTALLLTDVDRGAHTLSVALVDAGGRELARAAPVTVYVKPPVARR